MCTNIRGTAQVDQFGNQVLETRLRWFGHVQKRERRQGEGTTEPHDHRKVMDLEREVRAEGWYDRGGC